MSARRLDVLLACEREQDASTEPRCCQRGDLVLGLKLVLLIMASTEPRCCQRGDVRVPLAGRSARLASTEPRCCQRGDHTGHTSPAVRQTSLQRSRAVVSAETAWGGKVDMMPSACARFERSPRLLHTPRPWSGKLQKKRVVAASSGPAAVARHPYRSTRLHDYVATRPRNFLSAERFDVRDPSTVRMLAQIDDHNAITPVVDSALQLRGQTYAVDPTEHAQEHTVLQRRSECARDAVDGSQPLRVRYVVRQKITAAHATAS